MQLTICRAIGTVDHTKVLRRHLRYLTPETVVHSQRAQIVRHMTKSEMVSKILSVPRLGSFEVGSSKAVVVDDEVPLSLTNFIGKDSWLFSA